MHLWQPRRNVWVSWLEFTCCEVLCKCDVVPGMIRDLEQKHGPVRDLLAQPEVLSEGGDMSFASDSWGWILLPSKAVEHKARSQPTYREFLCCDLLSLREWEMCQLVQTSGCTLLRGSHRPVCPQIPGCKATRNAYWRHVHYESPYLCTNVRFVC